jgi:type IV secretion system protein VirD4
MFLMLSDRFWAALQEDHWLCLILALVIYGIFRAPIKNAASGIYAGILRFLHKGRYGRGGSARFIGLIEEWQMQWRPLMKVPAGRAGKNLRAFRDFGLPPRGHGLFMGRSLYNRFLHVELKDDRHMITIAGSRGGKGVSAIIPNLLTFEGSVLCIDPKGENAKVTARRRREMGQKVYIVDPFGITGEESACYNPLENLDPDSLTIREDLAVISDALVVHDKDVKDSSHWEDGARTVLTGLQAQLVTDPQYRKDGAAPTLTMIRDLLSGLKQKEWLGLLVDMSKNRGAGDAARDAATRIMRGIESNEMASILSNADKHSEWLSYPSMRAALSKSSFRFSELKEKPTTIYLVIPPEYLDTHQRFQRLFINLALNEMPKGGPSKVPVLMILDEFLQLGKMNQVERAFRLLAGYNFVLWPFIQDLGSMKEIYNQGMSAFFANCRAIQLFSVADDATLKYASELIGARSMHFIPGMDSERFVALRDPSEVSLEVERETGMQYVLRAGKPAMLLERVRFFEDQSALKSLRLNRLIGRLPARLRKTLFPFAGLYDPAN